MDSRISGLNSSELPDFAGTGFETSSGRQTGEDMMVCDDKISRVALSRANLAERDVKSQMSNVI